MARLIAISPMRGLPFPGLRPSQMTRMPLDENGKHKNFKFHVRGPQVLLETEPGYRYGTTPEGNARKVYELPRAETFLEWELDPGEDVRDLVNWSPPDRGTFDDEEPAGPTPSIERPMIELVNVEPGSPLVTEPATESVPASLEPDVEEADPDDDDDLPTRTTARKGRRG